MIGAVAFLIPRIFFVGHSYNYAHYLQEGVSSKVGFHWLFYLAKAIVLVWYGMWIPFALGVRQLSRRFLLVGASLLLGTLAGCLVVEAGDYERMFGMMAPLLIPATAVALQRCQKSLQLMFAATFPLQVLAIPHVIGDSHRLLYHIILVLAVAITVSITAFVFIVRRP